MDIIYKSNDRSTPKNVKFPTLNVSSKVLEPTTPKNVMFPTFNVNSKVLEPKANNFSIKLH